MARLISTQHLAFATIMGTLSFAMQIFVPGIPLGMGKIELAELPAILGAAFTGPTGGALTGFLYGLGSGVPLAVIPASMFSYALLGYLSKNLKMRWMTIPIVLVFIQAPLGAILVKILYYGASVPLYVILLRSLWYTIPGAIILVPSRYQQKQFWEKTKVTLGGISRSPILCVQRIPKDSLHHIRC